MSQFTTLDLINAMADHAEAHDWQSVTPELIFRGPIAPGNLTFPCMAIYAIGGQDTGQPGYGTATIRESFKWTIAQHLGLGDVVDQYQDHMRWRDEVRGLCRQAIDQYWGMGGVVTMTNISPAWESDFYQMGEDANPVANLIATTLRMEVEYREQF